MAIRLKLTQVKSGVGRSETQRRTLEGLGLRGPHKTAILQDTLAIRGMIRKVS
ncbi:MAG TPA: 50S ribosomal protein L30, partial [Kofleriaceae bacterium]|nr:50S ribosomal protein L30 [Kofleriaceae bacterium]